MFQTISTLDEWLHVPYISLLLYHARVDETTFLKVNFVLVYTSWSKKRELEIKIKYGY